MNSTPSFSRARTNTSDDFTRVSLSVFHERGEARTVMRVAEDIVKLTLFAAA